MPLKPSKPIQNFTIDLKQSYSFLLLVVSMLCISSCAPKFSENPLPPDPPQTFSLSGNDSLSLKWWEEFEDSELDQFIQTGLDSNYNLLASLNRIEAALALAKREGSNLYPSVEAGLQSGLSVPEPDFVGGELFQFGFRASYEIDLFGRIRAAVEAEEMRANATIYEYRAGMNSLSADIGFTYFSWKAALQRKKLLESQFSNNKKVLDLLRARFGSGQVLSVDILRQQQLVQSTELLLLQAKTTLATVENQLNVLIGKVPQNQLTLSNKSFSKLPPLPNSGIPAELIQRRPDVQASFSRLKAADRDLASAISNRYPRLSINANFQARANNFSQLFEGWAYSFAGNLVGPIFYGGRLKAEADRTEAVKNQLLNDYYQVVLQSFQEVEDALIREENQRESLKILKEQLELAKQTTKQIQRQYLNGMGSYLDVLAAINQKQNIELSLITTRRDLFQNRIGLYRALAGGIFDQSKEEQQIN